MLSFAWLILSLVPIALALLGFFGLFNKQPVHEVRIDGVIYYYPGWNDVSWGEVSDD